MIADFGRNATVVPGAEVNGVVDMTGDLELEESAVLYVSGEESVQQVRVLLCMSVQHRTEESRGLWQCSVVFWEVAC